MARALTGNPNGRAPKEIDWNVVDRLLISGCDGTEIAPHFDIHPTTLYQRTEKEFGVSFSVYSQQKRFKGESLLRDKQFKEAMEGNTTLLIWLGKNRLKQRDTPLDDNIPEDIKKEFDSLMDATKQLQRACARKRADINSNEESKS